MTTYEYTWKPTVIDERRDERHAITEPFERLAWYTTQLNGTLSRSKHDGRIARIYKTGYYVRAIVDVDGMAHLWRYDTMDERWKRNTMGKSRPPVPMSRSRAMRNDAWGGS